MKCTWCISHIPWSPYFFTPGNPHPHPLFPWVTDWPVPTPQTHSVLVHVFACIHSVYIVQVYSGVVWTALYLGVCITWTNTATTSVLHRDLGMGDPLHTWHQHPSYLVRPLQLTTQLSFPFVLFFMNRLKKMLVSLNFNLPKTMFTYVFINAIQ